jgi:hypothetical protein
MGSDRTAASVAVPVGDAVAEALPLLDVAPGVKMLSLLWLLPAGDVAVALLLAPAPVSLTNALALLDVLF